MQIDTRTIDAKFEGYRLSIKKIPIAKLELKYPPLKPLTTDASLRKSEWDARVYYNSLTTDLDNPSMAYYLSEKYEIIQIEIDFQNALQPIKVRLLYSLPRCMNRKENASIREAGKGLLVYSDGNGALMFLRADGMNCELVYECQPLGLHEISMALLCASYDTKEEYFRCLVAETMEDVTEEQMRYRIWMVEVRNRRPDGSMDVDSGPIGLYHDATELALTTKLPSYNCFEGPDLLLYVEGEYSVMVEDMNLGTKSDLEEREKEGQQIASEPSSDDTTSKNGSAEKPLLSIDEVLAMKPRPGIGYHGDVTHVKALQELGLMQPNDPSLDMRFQKATESQNIKPNNPFPFATRNPNSPKPSAEDFEQENTTMRCILDGFEECDVTSDDIWGSLLLFDGHFKSLLHQIRLKLSNFKCLATSLASGQSGKLAPILFQHDIHGLLYTPSISCGKIQMQHYHTFQAFGFVQASKQERMCTTFAANGNFVALGEFKRRVFIYHSKARKEEVNPHIQEQHVIEYGDSDLLGLQAMDDRALLILSTDCMLLALIDNGN